MIEKKTHEITTFTTSDGKEFSTEESAKYHQRYLDVVEIWANKPILNEMQKQRLLRYLNICHQPYSSIDEILNSDVAMTFVIHYGITPDKLGRWMTTNRIRNFLWNNKEKLLQYANDAYNANCMNFKVYDLDRENYSKPLKLTRTVQIDFGEEK